MEANREAWLAVITEYHEKKQHWMGEGENLLTFESFLVDNFLPPVRKDSPEAEALQLLRDRKQFVADKVHHFAERYGVVGSLVGGEPMENLKTALAELLAKETSLPQVIVLDSMGSGRFAQGDKTNTPKAFDPEPMIIKAVERLQDPIYEIGRTNPNPENRPNKSRKQRNKPRR